MKMRFPGRIESRFYPGGDERQETVPVSEFEPVTITGKDQAEYADRFAEYVFDRVTEHLNRAFQILDAPNRIDTAFSPYMRAYAHIIRALELEPNPFSTSASDALTALFWDLKGIRVAMEQVKPYAEILNLIWDLTGECRNGHNTGGEF